MYMWMSSLRRKYSFTQLQHTTGMAQRKRAGLITLRTPDRNGLPVLLINSHQCSRHLEHFAIAKHSTGVAQRQSVSKHRLLPSWLYSLLCEWLSPYKRKVTGSKPVAGNIFNLVVLKKRPPPCSDNINAHTYSTPLAQRQSARLITWRSSDQNPQEVFYPSVALQKRPNQTKYNPYSSAGRAS